MRGKKLEKPVLEMKGITKQFPGVLANDHIDFDIKRGEIHALLGENGAGKTTLMNILYGLYQPDEGEIYINGRRVTIKSPEDAINLGIGMVHQHFMLIPSLTVTENIILGLKSSKGPFLDIDGAKKRVTEFSKKYGLKVDPEAKIWQLSLGERQRVEIIKALFRGAQVLILDEPTSVLTPSEVKELMNTLRRMANEGMAVIPFITHKLPEVMAISDRVTVLRRGKVVGKFKTKRVDEKCLARRMVGREVLFRIRKGRGKQGKIILEVKKLQALGDRGELALKGISFSVNEGEILGIAGVAGNGQRELVEVITGLRRASAGKVLIRGQDLTNRSPIEIIKAGVAHVPEDKIVTGLVPNLSVGENILLKSYRDPSFSGRLFLNQTLINQHVKKLISKFGVVAPGVDTKVKLLSGGNLQRLILAREISDKNLRLMVAAYPTRGLDIAATESIRKMLLSLREKGVATLLVSEDLDEIMMLSDKIAVIFEGRIMGILPTRKAEIGKIGLMMAGKNV